MIAKIILFQVSDIHGKNPDASVFGELSEIGFKISHDLRQSTTRSFAVKSMGAFYIDNGMNGIEVSCIIFINMPDQFQFFTTLCKVLFQVIQFFIE